jgi:D-alanine-D-alanine ligase-like ATP-grasp enzyme
MRNMLVDARTAVGLGRRYLRTRRRLQRAIRKNRADYYTESWLDAASAAGCEVDHLGSGFLRIRRGGRSVIVFEQQTPLNDAATNRLIQHKPIIYRMLDDLGVLRPRFVHLEGADLGPARVFRGTIHGPLVMKPAFGTGAGAGVTTNVSNGKDLVRAFAWARAFCPETIAEEQLAGLNYRLLFLDGEYIDGVVRHPPTVLGDGQSTIRQLIERENRLRTVPGARVAQSLIEMNLDTRLSLRAQGLGLSSTPERGSVVKVKDVVNDNRATENAAVGELHASFRELGRDISRAFGVSLVGVDVIAPSVASSLAESGGRVIEINTPPGHFYHHLRSGGGYDVASRLLDHMLPASQ